MITAEERHTIRKSWEQAAPLGATVADRFYQRFFEQAPQYRQYFRDDSAAQQLQLLAALAFVASALDWPDDAWHAPVDPGDDLFLAALALGRRNREVYRVPDEAFAVATEALLWALHCALGGAFTLAVRDAWARACEVLSQAMKMGRFAVDAGSRLAEATHA